MHRKIGVGVTLLAAILAAGCGSSNDSTATSPSKAHPATALSKPQYVKQANAICAKGLKEKDEAVGRALKESVKSGATEEDASKNAAKAALPVFREMVEQLDELGVPAKDKVRIDQIINKYEEALAQVEADTSSLVSENPFREADKAAISYGLQTCNA